MTRTDKRLGRTSIAAGLALIAAVVSSDLASAQQLHSGQYPVPPPAAWRSALPDCGFAATESQGPNGSQPCDPRNMHGAYQEAPGW